MHMVRTSLLCAAAWAAMQIPAPALDRPEWMDQPGIVMAGSWEEPSFRARRMGRTDYTLPADLRAQYAREHTPEMIAQLKDWGVNFVMIHCYKGAGFKTEQEGMEDAKRFTRLAHQAGLRVGAYIGGTMLYERLFEEEPKAPQWRAFGPHGEPLYYHPSQQFRYAAVRNHPGFIEYLKKPVRFAVEEMHADLIHFDNFGYGRGQLRSILQAEVSRVLAGARQTPRDPPLSDAPNTDPLVRDWNEYKCQALADHYAAMSRYIRSLNPQCGVECNPGGGVQPRRGGGRHRSRPAAPSGQCLLGRGLRDRLVREDGYGPNTHPHAQSRRTLPQFHFSLLRKSPWIWPRAWRST